MESDEIQTEVIPAGCSKVEVICFGGVSCARCLELYSLEVFANSVRIESQAETDDWLRDWQFFKPRSEYFGPESQLFRSNVNSRTTAVALAAII